MKKGCLARFLAFVFFLGCLALGWQDFVLTQQNGQLQSRLDQANAQLAAAAIAAPHHKGAKAAASDDWLTQAQKHANKAAQAVRDLDFTTSYREWQAAGQSLEQQPKHMSAQMRTRYDSVKKQLDGIKEKVTSLWGG